MIHIILGRRGSGKSYLTKQTIANIDHAIIIDPLDEYSGVIVHTSKDAVKYISEHRNFFRVVCRFDDDDELDEIFKSAKLLSTIGHEIYYVVEESDLICSPHYILDGFSRLIRHGRHYNTHIIAVSRRPAEINKLLLSQADKITCFKFTEPNDLKYLDAIGFSTDELTALDQDKHEQITKTF